MKKRILIVTGWIFIFQFAYAQTFNSTSTTSIATNGINYYNDITVSGIGVIMVGGTELSSLTINITHTYDGDLDIYLVAPDASQIELSTDNGGSSDNYINTVFSDAGATTCVGQSAPFTGTFKPESGTIASFNNGQNADGVWRLKVYDDAGGDVGTIDSWSITFTPAPTCPAPSALTASTITGSSANLSWTENGNATLWDIELGVSGFSPTGTATQTGVTSYPHTYNGLSELTSYDFYVRADCGDGDESSWSGPYNFITPCGSLAPLNLPYTQDFENSSGSQTNDGTFICSAENQWTLDTDNSYGRIRYGSNAVQNNGGTGALSMDLSSGSTNTINYAIMTVDLSPYTVSTTLELSFDFSHHGEESNSNDRVWIRGSSSDSWLEIYDWYANKAANGVFISTGALDIDALLSANGQTPSSSFQIRFGQEDNSSASSATSADGLTIDNVKINELVPMSYISSTCTQNTESTFPAASNHDILRLEVITAGSLSPLNLTECVLNMNGTTDLADVSNIKIFYTGADTTFASSNYFGSVAPNTGSLNIVGNQALLEGSNYFWLCYDISSSATLNNLVDMECSQISMDGGTGAQTPSNGAPLGEREILDIVTCEHAITLYDFSDNGWGGGTVEVKVNGTSVLSGLTLTGSDNGTSYTFEADDGDLIEATYSGSGTEPKYVITGANGDFILEDGTRQSWPTTESGTASCKFINNFTLNGDAYYNGESLSKSNSSGDCITLTSEIRDQSASAWYNYKINLQNDFSIGFDLWFGDNVSLAGADGIVFSLQNECSSTGGSGSSIGFGGISPSLGIEFDTYYNGGNGDLTNGGTESDHANIFQDGSNQHYVAEDLSMPNGYKFGQNALKGNDYKAFTVDWSASTQTLSIHYGATEILTYTGDLVTDIFSGESEVYWGFTSGTGWSTNVHKIRMTQYPGTNTTQLIDETINQGESTQLEVASGGVSYTWAPNDGSINNASIANPIFSPTVTTEYNVQIEDACGNIFTDDVIITVNSVLPVELINFQGECQERINRLDWSTASEINNSHFVIEKSTDGLNYNAIGQINGQGNSASVQNYQFIDQIINQNLNYYRLKQSDYDGRSTYYKSIAVNCKHRKQENINAKVYFKSNSQLLICKFPEPLSTDYQLELIDCLGKHLLRYQIDEGCSYIEIPMPFSLAQGTYIVHLTNHQEQQRIKVVKY